VKAFGVISEKWKKTLIVDNGKEFAGFKDIEDSAGMKLFFVTLTPFGKEAQMKIRTG